MIGHSEEGEPADELCGERQGMLREVRATSDGPVRAFAESDLSQVADLHRRVFEVPDVVGQSHVEAGSTIEGIGLVADSYPVASTEPRGTVVAQRPTAGTQLEEGDTVRMNVALGEGARETREVPDVTGPQGSDARATLRRAGFTVRTLPREPPTPEESGEVLTQQPTAGTSAPKLTQVTIFVGR